jgi:hypothetical protein
MSICRTCGKSIKPPEWSQHSLDHVMDSRIPVDRDAEAYWRERISQEILGERMAAEVDPNTPPPSPHYMDGLDTAYDIAKDGL